jgi:hypothetical protein
MFCTASSHRDGIFVTADFNRRAVYLSFRFCHIVTTSYTSMLSRCDNGDMTIAEPAD